LSRAAIDQCSTSAATQYLSSGSAQTQLVDDEVSERLKKMFRTADGSGTGYIPRDSARELIKKSGLPTITEEQFDTFFDALGTTRLMMFI
jgi:Ca2+-binding EF-hand superfamily protein